MANLSSGAAGDGGTALFSECGNYRYLLTRRLRPVSADGQTCLFIMLNPSTADADVNDSTISRCMDFAVKWGMAELRVVNLFALRATDPGELRLADDPVGPDNDRVIADELRSADLVIAAWGNAGTLQGRAEQVRSFALVHLAKVRHLAVNKTGQPRHPLYVRSETRPSPVTRFLRA